MQSLQIIGFNSKFSLYILNLQFSCPQSIFMIAFLDSSKYRKAKFKIQSFMYSWKLKKSVALVEDLSLAPYSRKVFSISISVGLDLPWIMYRLGLDLELISSKIEPNKKLFFRITFFYWKNGHAQWIFFSPGDSKQRILSILQMVMRKKCYILTHFLNFITWNGVKTFGFGLWWICFFPVWEKEASL